MKFIRKLKKGLASSYLVIVAVVLIAVAGGTAYMQLTKDTYNTFNIEGTNWYYTANADSVEKGIITFVKQQTPSGEVIMYSVGYCNGMGFTIARTDTYKSSFAPLKTKRIGGVEYGQYGGFSTAKNCPGNEDERSMKEAGEIFDSLREN